jgi:hypothetical protein
MGQMHRYAWRLWLKIITMQMNKHATLNAVVTFHWIPTTKKTVLLPYASYWITCMSVFLFKQSLKYDLKKHILNPLDKYTCIHPSYSHIHNGIHCNRHYKCMHFLTKYPSVEHHITSHHMFHCTISCFKGQNKQRMWTFINEEVQGQINFINLHLFFNSVS